jgi:hypothetical protein
MKDERSTMAGKVSGRRQKFPNFIEYANDCTTFQCMTEATLERAWWLAIDEFIPVKRDPARNSPWKLKFEAYPQNLIWIYETAKWSYKFIWEMLLSNQVDFKILLDAIINKCVVSIHVELLEKHDNHVRIYNSWLYRPCEIFPSHRSGPSLQPNEYIRLQDPLDGIYWSLGKFLRLGGEQRLRKCPVCQRYFIQPTARPQTHCTDACRLMRITKDTIGRG